MQRSNNIKGALLALLAFALFSAHDVVVKTLGASFTTFQIIFFSVLLSFPLVMLMLMRDTTRGNLIPRHPWWTALRTGSAVVTGLCIFYAFASLPMAQVYAIIFAMPLIITVLSIPILGETVGMHRWGAVVVGLVGVIVVLRPGQSDLEFGHLAALVGACTGSLVSIIVRKIGQDERSAVLLLYPMMANFAVMACALPFVYVPLELEELGLVGLMALLAFGGGLCSILAYKAGDAAIVAPMQYSQMIWAAVYGSFFFGEHVDQVTWIGAGIIIASGIYIVLRESFGGRSLVHPVLQNRSRAETGTTPRVSLLARLSRKPGGEH
ncbi:DMT family transporter [Vannielia litorea]|uniref:Permease of the drug/metabolite transporter (DMT) superfamily n=1 Tax=Vannielia litorea TaxID=1217970 RepID=A0A1N6IEH0_9RHOB|nr:DMT family transporter [Vannielia litorea]SIO30434.1 Permease of the drug/metabolite transporter (DMT) superfamily [Vannielia litorea]